MEQSSLSNSPAPGCSPNQEACHIWGDVLAQAVTGELIAALNYETLAGICTEADEKVEALEHAAGEKAHAARFRAAGRDLGIEIPGNIEAPYWKRIRLAFLSRARAGDFVACLLVQEVMLESFAVATYQQIGEAAPGKLGTTFAIIAAEEAEHIDHSIALLQAERAHDPQRFDAKVHELHQEVMTILAEMVAREDPSGHCGLCHGSCAKPSLPRIGLNISGLRGVSLRHYMKTLDRIGLPGEVTLAWVAQLPV